MRTHIVIRSDLCSGERVFLGDTQRVPGPQTPAHANARTQPMEDCYTPVRSYDMHPPIKYMLGKFGRQHIPGENDRQQQDK